MSWNSNPQIPPKQVGWWVNPTPSRDAIRNETWGSTLGSRVTAPVATIEAIFIIPSLSSTVALDVSAMAAIAEFIIPSISATVEIIAPTMTATVTASAPTVLATANCDITAPVATATAAAVVPTVDHTASIEITAPIATATANAVVPEVIFSGMYQYTSGGITFNIPNIFHKFDLVMVGGGAGGTGGGASYVAGGGGYAAGWNHTTITRGTEITWERTQLTGAVGGGGWAGSCNLNPGGAGGTSYINGVDSFGGLSAAGGGGQYGWNDSIGRGPYNHSYNGITYPGGGNNGGWAQPGNWPGGGGGGGQGGLFGCISGGGAGAGGSVWIYAYTTNNFVPPIQAPVATATGSASAPTVFATRNLEITAPVATATAESVVPAVVTSLPTAFDATQKATGKITLNSLGIGGLNTPNMTVDADADVLLVFVTYQYAAGFNHNVYFNSVAATNVDYILYYNSGGVYAITQVYKLMAPSAGSYPVQLVITGGYNGQIIYTTMHAMSYKNVASVSAPQKTNSYGTAMSLGITNTPAGGMAVESFGSWTAAISAFNQTQRQLSPFVSGVNLAQISGDAAGTGGTVTFSATNASSMYWGGIGVNLSPT